METQKGANIVDKGIKTHAYANNHYQNHRVQRYPERTRREYLFEYAHRLCVTSAYQVGAKLHL
jgi:hypothetical protein